MRESGSFLKNSFNRLLTTFTSCHLSHSASIFSGNCQQNSIIRKPFKIQITTWMINWPKEPI